MTSCQTYAQIMMDVDQPVSSTTGDEQPELDAESSRRNVTDKASEMIVRENDDLPALLISDSEEDESPKVPNVENQTVDISGITPIETTVTKVNDECDDTINETTVHPTQETSALSAVDEEDISLVDNIDLTGASSAEDSAVNEPTSERTSLAVIKVATQTKPSSEMTAQELLESLLEAQEEALASQRAEETLLSKDTDKAVNASNSAEIPKNILESTNGEVAKDATIRDASEPAEDSPKMESLVVDDECLLEEMVNEPKRQQEKDIDEHRTGTNNSSCSDDGSGTSHHSNDAGKAKSYNNDDIVTLSEKCEEKSGEMVECSEPPRKRARSMVTEPDPQSKAGANESTMIHGVENDNPSEDVASHSDNLHHGTEQLHSHPDMKTNLPAVETEPVCNVIAVVSQTVMTVASIDASNGRSDLLISQKQQGIALGVPKNVQPVETSVCTDVLVIDDDEDEAKIDAPEENNMPMVPHSETTAKSPDVDDANSRLSSASQEKPEAKPMAMEFLRRFNKPITSMTRMDLEQLVLQKISEAIVHQTENAELRRIVKKQSAKLQGYERTITDMSSHYEGLKLVAERAVEDMKNRAKSFVAPVKITRAVGLQVSRPAMDMAYKSPSLSRIMPEKQKVSPSRSTASVATNGTIANRAQAKPVEPMHKATQQIVPLSNGQPNASANVNRSQLSSNVSPMTTARITPNVPMSNGMMRIVNSQSGKHYSSASTTNVSLTPGSTVKLATALAKDGPGASVENAAPFASASQNTGSASNSIPAGIESPVRKKFHKFTPKRPPLSPYQQAQQEKQARQQQELLVQQIHEQSQQAQRKAQINVRSDLPTNANSSACSPLDAARQRSLASQGRLLNANLQTPVSHSYQVVSFGGTRPTTAMTNSTALQLSEPKPNSQPTTKVASSGNDSLIDLTDEDDTSGRESGMVSSIQIKRMKTSNNGPFTATLTIPGNASSNASNQFLRLQPKINTVSGSAVVPIGAGATSVSGVNQFNNVMVRAPLNVNRTTNAHQPLRQPMYNGNLPRLRASSPDPYRHRIPPLPQPGPQPSDPSWQLPPPQPSICVNNVQAGIVISWTMPTHTVLHALIETYQIYAYQQLNTTTSKEEWRHVGDVKALLLPMAVTLTQFNETQ
uniref:Fibronectin type-III domain-containing protein n=1 Tax=Anopheles minimus TaxID=112268 RepID=A0A182WAD2_9DIPT